MFNQDKGLTPYTTVIQTCHGYRSGTMEGANAGQNGHFKSETYLGLGQTTTRSERHGLNVDL